MRAIGEALAALGVDPARVTTEAFGAVAVPARGIVGGRRPRAARAGRPARHAARRSRSSAAASPSPWDDRFPSLLDFAEACDVPVGFGCRNGVCHNCESGLLAGDVATRTPSRSSRRPTARSCRCTRPASELTLDL